MIFERIINISNNQYNNFTNYLKQKNFDHNLLVVDIGWHGSLQKLLQKITKTPKIFGCYIGIYDNANLLNDCEGYVFDKGKKLDEQYKLFSFVSLFETMFLAHEGTTISYRNVGQKIEAVLAPYEYDNDKKSLEIVSDIQKGTFKFIDDYKNSNININLNANICSYNILKFGSSPNKRDIETFGKISFENYQVHNIINFNKSSLYYFTHPKNMINDFFTSGWRVVFLKKLFKIPFPYYYLLKILCIVFKKEQ